MKKINKNLKILEGSRAISLAIKAIEPAVVSAYPITPQTHIVEDLAKFKANGQAKYEYLKAESEFAAASIVLGASAKGVRAYSATSSQGLLLMTEVLFNIAGLRLPLVMTCANRAVSAPINIWNDHSDAMVIRDSGWILLFAENHDEAVKQHFLAYKIAEQIKLPVMVNVDGYILTHAYEAVYVPERKEIKKFLPDYKPSKGDYLDPKNPVSIGAFATPKDYQNFRKDMHEGQLKALSLINKEYKLLNQLVYKGQENIKQISKLKKIIDNGLIEYWGSKDDKKIIVAMGSVIGTIKEAAKDTKGLGVLKIKSFRPFPKEEVLAILKNKKHIAVLEKAISLGSEGPLTLEIKSLLKNHQNQVKNYISGLGGKDITVKMIKKIINDIMKKDNKTAIFLA